MSLELVGSVLAQAGALINVCNISLAELPSYVRVDDDDRDESRTNNQDRRVDCHD